MSENEDKSDDNDTFPKDFVTTRDAGTRKESARLGEGRGRRRKHRQVKRKRKTRGKKSIKKTIKAR